MYSQIEPILMLKVFILIICYFCEKCDNNNHCLLKYQFEIVDNVTTTTRISDCIWLHNHWEEQWLATQLSPPGEF